MIDPNHVVAERYGFINVPSCIWIDEDDRIVRPPDVTPVNDLFKSFTGIDSNIHHEELRAWVKDGVLPLALTDVAELQNVPTPNDELARLHRRVAAHLHRVGNDEAAAPHFEIARTLAPWDWTIHRGALPLEGDDPFGQKFFDYAEKWGTNGAPGYRWGNAALRSDRSSTD